MVKLPKLTKGKKYSIVWQDIEGIAGWLSEKELLSRPPVLVNSIYLYVGKGKAGYCFAGDSTGEEYGSNAVIPKANIRSIKPIK